MQSEETATCPEAYSIEVRFRLVTITQLEGKQNVMFTKEAKKESHWRPHTTQKNTHKLSDSPIVTEYSHGLSNTNTQSRLHLFRTKIQ